MGRSAQDGAGTTQVEGAAPWFADAAGPPAPDACVWLRAPRGPGGAPRLRAALWRAPGDDGADRGLVLLFPGRTEYLEKYAGVVARLRARGFAVASLDWRGQGLSDRAVPRLGHVGRFAEFQADVRALLGWPEVAAHPGPRVLLCHSMGGCIGLRAIHDGALTGEHAPAAAIFSAPMWGLSLGGAALFARPLARLAARLGFARRAARPGPADSTYVLDEPFRNNVLTTDERHWDRFVAQAKAHRELTLASPTFGWVDAAFAETAALSRADPAGVPRLLLLGSDEAVVDPEPIRAHAARSRGEATLAEIRQGRHETLMEDPDGPVGAPVWQAIDDFLHARGL
ncbi:alpha/beta hydrolase [Albimonas sp. CAU 1670]|uniref:alpha/beta fold hydrolase n=1 Tax=Albimonas sp. CAU 1670 TaxID=3032599 RepID=UPI0023DBC717|nr:alpha/beta hydrolase [Albimonas sp. CAU 1670]MDF2231652.1 alpha/beta hydrolase [Albimonas sp. CAU 1670]